MFHTTPTQEAVAGMGHMAGMQNSLAAYMLGGAYGMAGMGAPRHDAAEYSGKNPYPGSERHMTGTSIMAVAYEGGVVLGADCRTSTGNYVANRVSDKLDQVSDRIYVLRSGSAADTQAIGDIVKYYLNLHKIEINERPSVTTAATMLRDLIYGNKDRLMAGMICGGWDPVNGGSVYEVCAFSGSLVKQKWSIGGSGSSFIYGLVDSTYKEGMSRVPKIFLIKPRQRSSCLLIADAWQVRPHRSRPPPIPHSLFTGGD